MMHWVTPTEPPPAWREPMLLEYPHGMKARFDPLGHYLRPGDVVNGYLVDHFELEEGAVVAVLRYH